MESHGQWLMDFHETDSREITIPKPCPSEQTDPNVTWVIRLLQN